MGKKMKYDVSGVEPGSGLNHAKPGMYKAKIKEVNEKESKAGNDMLEIVLEILPKKKGYSTVWYYVLTDGSQDGRLREMLEAVGAVKRGAKKAKGAIDWDEVVGMTVQVQLKSDTDQDGEYRPRVGKVLGAEEEVEEDDDDSDDDEDEDEDEDTDDDDSDEDDDDESDDDDDEDDDDDSGYTEEELDDLSTKDLKEILEEWEIELDGKFSSKKAKAAILEAQESEDDEDDDDDDDEDDDESVDYSEWEIADLKSELKERGLPVKGKKKDLVTRLEEDDASDDDPFEGDDE